MDLWKDLNKITALFKRGPIKILMLDFDGTLAPIAGSPDKAKLSKESKNLLIKLSKKKGFYLAIISGRSLSELKKKVNLKNIIYAGNHGLEGEIFQQKYAFPVPDKALMTLKNIRGQLDKIAGRFKGVFIEDKGLTLSFHYRLVSKQQVPPVKLLFKKTLKSYLKTGLIYIMTGKMVFDVRPRLNWNKGSFAKLVINQIHIQTKTIPVVVFIGDDKTDEDVFQKVGKGITIKVGGDYRSNAKYRFSNTKDVFKFLEWIADNF
ncbi:MAG: trehalose-phosphatase [Candidatus Daviesbacteria bacterium]|nr:trehalose-phosphatase [Candidatus Daviesbacteria bacterium]